MKQPLVVIHHCSSLRLHLKIFSCTLISRLVLGKCDFTLSGWALLLNFISKMPYLGYLAILGCSID